VAVAPLSWLCSWGPMWYSEIGYCFPCPLIFSAESSGVDRRPRLDLKHSLSPIWVLGGKGEEWKFKQNQDR
jgi:hypothetical protein